jgi:predicted RNase H-like HicB family nuclease
LIFVHPPPRVLIRTFKSSVVSFTARIWKGDDGYFVAQCEELPGCITQGKTIEEVTQNFREALELYLEEALQRQEAAKLEPNEPIERIRFELAPA